MAGAAAHLSDEETSSSSGDELPNINLPSCSYKRLNRRHVRTRSPSESSEDSSDESSAPTTRESSDESSAPTTRASSDESSAPTTRASAARHCASAQAAKRAKAIRISHNEAIAKRRKLEEERAAKQRLNAELNIYKPGQCMKYIYVEIHPTLLSAWFMADVSRELEAAGTRIHSTPTLVHPGLIVWTRMMPQRLTTVDGQVKLSTSKQHCGMSLYVCTSQEVAERVADNTLLEHVGSLREMVDGELSLIVFGDFKSSVRKTANSNRKILTELQLEQIKIDLVISTGVDVQFMDSTSELGMWVMQCTRAVAEAPYKKKKRDVDYASAGFYMRGDNKKCVPVDREGHGLSRLWQQMISILPTSSLETARALCGKYKSPIDLMNSMDKSSGVGELAEVGVTRAGAPESRARRLGPELARKLHLLYSSRNGNIIVE